MSHAVSFMKQDKVEMDEETLKSTPILKKSLENSSGNNGDATTIMVPQNDAISDVDDKFPSPEEILEEVCSKGTQLTCILTYGKSGEWTERMDDVEVTLEKHKTMMQVIVSGRHINTLFSMLKKYGQVMSEEAAYDGRCGIVLSFLPERYTNIILACNDPLFWAMTADKVGQPADKVVMAFGPETVGIFTLESEEGDDNEAF